MCLSDQKIWDLGSECTLKERKNLANSSPQNSEDTIKFDEKRWMRKKVTPKAEHLFS